MQKVEQYQRHAQECRDLAAKMASAADGDQLLKIARLLDEMAEEREAFVIENPQFCRDR